MLKKNSNPIDAFFDFLGDLVTPRSGTRTPGGRTDAGDPSGSPGGRPGFRTAEEREAWEELDDYLREGRTRQASGRSQAGSSGSGRPPSSSLDQDYANLELPPGAGFPQVKTAYKRLLRQYHPDRHAGNPEKQRIANEITQKLNASYQRIKDSLEENSPH